MIMDKGIRHNRKNTRLKEYDYSLAGYYFVTVVSFRRKNIFGYINNDIVQLTKVGEIVENCWKEITSHFPYVEVDVYVVMPSIIFMEYFSIINDVGVQHAEPLQKEKKFIIQPLGVIIRSFKSAVTKYIHDLGLLDQEKIWQRNYYEHIIRD